MDRRAQTLLKGRRALNLWLLGLVVLHDEPKGLTTTEVGARIAQATHGLQGTHASNTLLMLESLRVDGLVVQSAPKFDASSTSRPGRTGSRWNITTKGDEVFTAAVAHVVELLQPTPQPSNARA